jgi:GWxTD domain-containing protein
MKQWVFFTSVLFLFLCLVGCNQVAPLQETPMQSKYYKWTQQSFHPRVSVTAREKDSITYTIFFDADDWSNSAGNMLEIRAHSIHSAGAKDWSKNYMISEASNVGTSGKYYCQLKLPLDSSCVDLQFYIKESKSIREGIFRIPYLPVQHGWVWNGDLGTSYCPSGISLSLPKNGTITFAPRTEKLPSPPFSVNLPFIPNEQKKLDTSDSTLIAQPGMLNYQAEGRKERLHIIDKDKNPEFPEISQLSEMLGPVRFLCSKEEFEKIQQSHEGPENAFDKFWIRCGGNKAKAKELIKIYYSRVQDANFHFTSYADGWKTDRGMIYLVFGHPNTIITDAQIETWIYGNINDPQALKFDFEIKDDPIWGDIYLLKRSENYRSPWESQVTQWRQGRIYP